MLKPDATYKGNWLWHSMGQEQLEAEKASVFNFSFIYFFSASSQEEDGERIVEGD